MAEFTIANTGAGIPPEILPRVFDRFFRGDPAHSQAVDGCGLGLSIAQWIVSAHNGTIKIESDNGETNDRHRPSAVGSKSMKHSTFNVQHRASNGRARHSVRAAPNRCDTARTE